MKDPKTIMRIGVIGTALAVLCCITPVLLILLGALGLSAFAGYLDYVLLPVLAGFIGLTIYAIRRQADAGRTPNQGGDTQ